MHAGTVKTRPTHGESFLVIHCSQERETRGMGRGMDSSLDSRCFGGRGGTVEQKGSGNETFGNR